MKEPRNHFEGLDFEQKNNFIDLNCIKKCRGSCVGELMTRRAYWQRHRKGSVIVHDSSVGDLDKGGQWS